MKPSDLQSRINDLQLKIGDLRESSLDPSQSLEVALEKLSSALEELNVAQEELCQQDESLQSAYLTIESERQRYLELFNFAPDGYLVTDLNGTITEANVASTELLQSSPIGSNLAEFLDNSCKPELESMLRRLNLGEKITSWEIEIIPKAGRPVPVTISANATHDLRGDSKGLRWQIHDITRLKDAKEALQNSEEKHKLLIENANEAIIVAQDEAIKFANPKFLEITGRTIEEIKSEGFAGLIHPDDRKMVIENHHRRLQGEQLPETYAFRINGQKGEVKWVEISSIRISWMGRPATLNLLSDVTKRKEAEERLRLFKSVVANASEGVVVVAPSTSGRNRLEIDYVNRAFEEMTGYDEEELVGRDPEVLSGPKTDPAHISTMEEAVSKREPIKLEKVNCRKDGTSYWSEISLFPLLSDRGEADFWVSIERDVTARHRYEEELSANKEKFRDLVENINDIIYSTDERGIITYVSPAVEHMAGYSPSELLGRSFEELLPHDERSARIDIFRKALLGEPIISKDIRILTKSGETRWVHCSSRLISKNGKPAGLTGVVADITEFKRAECALHENLNFIQRLTDTIPSPIFYKGLNGRYLGCNKAFEELVGRRRDDILGMSVRDLAPKDVADRHQEMDEALFSSPGAQAYEAPVCGADGRLHDFMVNKATYTDDSGRVAGIVGVLLDITELKRAEQEIKERESELCAIYENAPVIMMLVDCKRRVRKANKFAEKFAGTGVGDMIGLRGGEALGCLYSLDRPEGCGFGPECQECITRKTVIDTIETGRSHNQVEASRPFLIDGKRQEITYLLSTASVNVRGERQVLVTIQDITKRKEAEEALQKSKDYLDKIINSVGDPIFVKDRQHRIVLANDALCSLAGRSREEVLGKTDYDLFPLEQAEVFWEMDDLVFSTGKENMNEEEITDSQVHTHSIITKKTIYIGPEGDEFLVGIIRDITDRKVAEDKIRAAYKQLLEIIEFLPDPTFVIDQDKKVIAWNKAIEDLTGVPKSEVMGRGDNAYGEAFCGRQEKILIDFLDEPEPASRQNYSHIEKKADTLFAETYMPPRSGRPGADLWCKASPLIDHNGKHVGAIESIRDITERNRTAKSLEKSERKYRSIVEQTRDAVVLLDESGHIVDWNAGAEKITGLKRSEAIGRPVWEVQSVLIPDDLKFPGIENKIKEKATEILKTGRSPLLNSTGEHKIQRADRTQAVVEESLCAIPTEKGFMICSNMRDITSRKLSEETRERLVRELESKNTEMERFIYTVSHDLRSPLVTVNGFVGMLKSDLARGNTGRVEVDLKMISDAVSRMDRLLDDTLQLSRIGRVICPIAVVSFEDMAREAADLVSDKAKARGINVRIEPNLPQVNVDRMRIVEVLTNLIENSVKYIGDQPLPEIEIGYRPEGVFFVKDNGMGIDESQHEKVFGLFYKVDNKSEGSGAGLAIVRRIIEVHGGRIWIESGIGEGCTVCFTLPKEKLATRE